jgi:hypothetical protein
MKTINLVLRGNCTPGFEFECKLIDLKDQFKDITNFEIIGVLPLTNTSSNASPGRLCSIGSLLNSCNFDLLKKINSIFKGRCIVLYEDGDDKKQYLLICDPDNKREYQILKFKEDNDDNVVGLDKTRFGLNIQKPVFLSDFFEGLTNDLNLAVARAQVVGLEFIYTSKVDLCQFINIAHAVKPGLFTQNIDGGRISPLQKSIPGLFTQNQNGKMSYNVYSEFFSDYKGNIVERVNKLLGVYSSVTGKSITVFTSHKDSKYSIINYKCKAQGACTENIFFVTCDFITYYSCFYYEKHNPSLDLSLYSNVKLSNGWSIVNLDKGKASQNRTKQINLADFNQETFKTICPNIKPHYSNKLDINYNLILDIDKKELGNQPFPEKYINFNNSLYFSKNKNSKREIYKFYNDPLNFEHDLYKGVIGRWYFLGCFLLSSDIVIVVHNVKEICEFIQNSNIFFKANDFSQTYYNAPHVAKYQFVHCSDENLDTLGEPNTIKITMLDLFLFFNNKNPNKSEDNFKKFDYLQMVKFIDDFTKCNIGNGNHIDYVDNFDIIMKHMENTLISRNNGVKSNAYYYEFTKTHNLLFSRPISNQKPTLPQKGDKSTESVQEINIYPFLDPSQYTGFFNDIFKTCYPIYSLKRLIFKEIKTLEQWVLYLLKQGFDRSKIQEYVTSLQPPPIDLKEVKSDNTNVKLVDIIEKKDVQEKPIVKILCYFCSIDVTRSLYDNCFITITDDTKRIVCKKCAKDLSKNERVKYTEENWNKSIKKIFKNSVNVIKPLVDKVDETKDESLEKSKNKKDESVENKKDKKKDEIETLKRKEKRKMEKEKVEKELRGLNPSLVEGIESEELKEKIYELHVSLPIEILKRDDDEENVVNVVSVKKEKKKERKLKEDISGLFEYKFNKE